MSLRKTLPVSTMIFAGGMCGLIYQMAWFQELRLIFGNTTAAAAIVTAVFMAGLGLGSGCVGKRISLQSVSPNDALLRYAYIEFAIAASAALTPAMLAGTRSAYIAMGGSAAMGSVQGTLFRAFFSGVILGIPAFFMGGTLPAALKACQASEDVGRTKAALLYGVNTAGAVVGVLAATFFMLETYGVRKTLLLTILANLMIAAAAYISARGRAFEREPVPEPENESSTVISANYDHEKADETASITPVTVIAFITGWTFFLSEAVWIRMLSPLLAGSVHTFGLILAVILAGIGCGSLVYSLKITSKPSWAHLGIVCAVEGMFLALPYRLGDALPIMQILLQPFDALGFSGRIFVWVLVTSAVVFPVSFVAGIRFPMLVAMAGSESERSPRDLGLVYAANTFGSVLGAVSGGFGLLAWLSATGCWKLAAFIPLAISIVITVWRCLSGNRAAALKAAAIDLAIVFTGMLFISGAGPTAVWRHGGVGAGRSISSEKPWHEIKDWMHQIRRQTIWESDGLESAVAVNNSDSIAFIINGKSDGSALNDAHTQILIGMIGAILHPAPRKCFLIGLGTGTTAGWMADVPGMERVEVIEIEEQVVEVASMCAPANRNALANPRISLAIGDAREILLTATGTYDLIVSEPSNPYRAGISNLYTREFFQAGKAKLSENGLFIQFVQAYEVDFIAIRTIYRTLLEVFPYIETWQTSPNDLLLVCSRTRPVYDITLIRERVQTPIFKEALWSSLKAVGIEGLFSCHVANSDFPAPLLSQFNDEAPLHTDDRLILEYGFSRTLGRTGLFTIADLRRIAQRVNAAHPHLVNGELNRIELDEHRLLWTTALNSDWHYDNIASGDFNLRVLAYDCFKQRKFPEFLQLWAKQTRPASHPVELAALAESLAAIGRDEALSVTASMAVYLPAEAHAINAMYHLRKDDAENSRKELILAIEGFRRTPFPFAAILERLLNLTVIASANNFETAKILHRQLKEPILHYLKEDMRKLAYLELSSQLGYEEAATALEQFEPYVPWREKILRYRAECYLHLDHPLKKQAIFDLQIFLRDNPKPLHGLSEN